jgi:hypothetical protein
VTPATPLVDPEGYFVPSEAFSLRRAAGLVTGFWVATTALGVAQRLTGDVGGPPLSPLYPLQTLEATLLYWVVPAVLLYGLCYAAGANVDSADVLALAAWGLVALLAGELVTNALYYGFAGFGIEPAGTVVDPALWLLGPLTLLACGWAGFVWRGGLRHGLGLGRTAATVIALLAAVGCAALLLLPAVT